MLLHAHSEQTLNLWVQFSVSVMDGASSVTYITKIGDLRYYSGNLQVV